MCLTLSDPMDCSPPGSSVHGILQARIQEQIAMSYSRGSSRPRDRTQVSCTGRWILYHKGHRGSPQCNYANRGKHKPSVGWGCGLMEGVPRGRVCGCRQNSAPVAAGLWDHVGVLAFLPRSKCLLISWLQSLSAVILEPMKIKAGRFP